VYIFLVVSESDLNWIRILLGTGTTGCVKKYENYGVT